MSAPLIDIRDVSRVYHSGEDELRALDRVSLTVEEGEFVAIVGQSGSGKSTLMNILGCLDRPTEGHYFIRGRDVAGLDRDALASLRRDTFGFVFQRYNLLANTTAMENVEVPAIYAGRPKKDRWTRAAELLTRLGLGDRLDHTPGQLSGGQQQRVSIARALMNDAPIILADEPTGALDRTSGAEMLTLLQDLNRDGRTIILITHDPEVARAARRVIRIADGRIVSDTRTDEALLFRPGSTHKVGGMHADGRLGFLPDMGEAAKLALRTLRTNMFRTSLTLLGVVIGVAAVVAMLAIGNGSQQQVMQRISQLGTNLLTVRPGAPGTRPTGDMATLVVGDAEAIAGLPNVEVVVPQRSTQKTMRAGNIDYRTQINGVTSGFPAAQDWQIAQGSFFGPQEEKELAAVVVLGDTVARNLFPDSSPIGKTVLIASQPFEVIGVLAPKGATGGGNDMDDIAVVPLRSAFMRVFGRDYLGSIVVRIKDLDKASQTEEAITSLLKVRHGVEDFQIRNTASFIATATETRRTFTMMLAAVAIISLIVGGIGVMNIMLVSVTERTREIGVRMATGARMLNILLQFNTEAVVVCGLGGLIGVGLGFAVAATMEFFGNPVAYSLGPPIFAFACAFLTGVVFGYLPARKAARMDPVAALASE
ncbi:macrolide export ATP-binding/permease protein MacB [Agaricicola taiwanensis]|uniref:Pyoverdine export ATP-binding/permease protein PvdT n=1 Tax=Agaricicola taiwanensis TaxID=591372 RepID=A0A8J2VN73_9RHOB|nr:MacB family efflux pump subunit [Agaricicola taiwanensis]GGE33278.1 macrolide export ATP-binding/permease protein MacB [Agaricicola taiwanensis]